MQSIVQAQVVGLVALCVVKQSAMIVCRSNTDVESWKNRILEGTNLKDNPQYVCLLNDEKMEFPVTDGYIFVTTYTALTKLNSVPRFRHFLHHHYGIVIADDYPSESSASYKTDIVALARLTDVTSIIRLRL